MSPPPLFGQIENNDETWKWPDFLKAKPRRSQANDFVAAAQVCVARSIRRFSAPFFPTRASCSKAWLHPASPSARLLVALQHNGCLDTGPTGMVGG
jgi:hypothetical protein